MCREIIFLIYPIRKITDYIGVYLQIGEIDNLFYRPKFIQNYADEQLDIVLSGHAQGGQFSYYLSAN